ncbi:MAG: DUF1934 domain-containing protein [Lachnospiraceae bacterium]|nr:DUF1934 domain-containing protein [Lachnospiraceae bacterium]
MTKNVIVSIKGLQTMGSGEDDTVELISAGIYKEENQQQIVEYEEVDEENQEITKVMLVIADGHVEIRKSGVAQVHMIFEEKQKTTSCYYTPYGELMMGLDTTKIKKIKTEDSMAVILQYGLEINYNFVADCNIVIKVISAND